MSVTIASQPSAESEPVEQRFEMGRVTWDAYLKISDALEGQPGLRLIYCDGRLSFVGKSRRHEWLSECLGHLVVGIAAYMGIPCEPAGEATYRRREKGAGLEGDRTFHFGANALKMRGGRDYDFTVDPPPDLAIEVEVSHPADEAVEAWGRARVPEVWRFNAAGFRCSFFRRLEDGSYESIARSLWLPELGTDDIVDLVREAEGTGMASGIAQLAGWVDRVIRPRRTGDLPRDGERAQKEN
jgi:Uma2 family endonuclease